MAARTGAGGALDGEGVRVVRLRSARLVVASRGSVARQPRARAHLPRLARGSIHAPSARGRARAPSAAAVASFEPHGELGAPRAERSACLMGAGRARRRAPRRAAVGAAHSASRTALDCAPVAAACAALARRGGADASPWARTADRDVGRQRARSACVGRGRPRTTPRRAGRRLAEAVAGAGGAGPAAAATILGARPRVGSAPTRRARPSAAAAATRRPPAAAARARARAARAGARTTSCRSRASTTASTAPTTTATTPPGDDGAGAHAPGRERLRTRVRVYDAARRRRRASALAARAAARGRRALPPRALARAVPAARPCCSSPRATATRSRTSPRAAIPGRSGEPRRGRERGDTRARSPLASSDEARAHAYGGRASGAFYRGCHHTERGAWRLGGSSSGVGGARVELALARGGAGSAGAGRRRLRRGGGGGSRRAARPLASRARRSRCGRSSGRTTRARSRAEPDERVAPPRPPPRRPPGPRPEPEDGAGRRSARATRSAARAVRALARVAPRAHCSCGARGVGRACAHPSAGGRSRGDRAERATSPVALARASAMRGAGRAMTLGAACGLEGNERGREQRDAAERSC